MLKYRISVADLNDLAALIAIENSCFVTDRLKQRQMRYLLTKAKAFTLLARSESDSKIVAYCSCLTPVISRPARLYSLAVLPDYRAQGIAGTLIKKTKQKLRNLGYSSCNLEVRKLDKLTQQLYEKHGFEVAQELPGYYEDGADGIKMTCKIRPAK